jgi:hypothetical protein
MDPHDEFFFNICNILSLRMFENILVILYSNPISLTETKQMGMPCYGLLLSVCPLVMFYIFILCFSLSLRIPSGGTCNTHRGDGK